MDSQPPGQTNAVIIQYKDIINSTNTEKHNGNINTNTNTNTIKKEGKNGQLLPIQTNVVIYTKYNTKTI